MIAPTKRRGIYNSSDGDEDGAGAEGLVGCVGAVKVVAAPFEAENGGDGGGAKAASDEGTKESELERRRQERAAQIEAK